MYIKLAENFRAVFYAPFYAAQALGLYAREGVEVELIGSAAPGDGVAALLAGEIDLSWGGPMRVMKGRELDPSCPLVCFGEVVARDPFFLVARTASFKLTDLPALRFAAVSEVPTPWMCLQHDLRRQGIDPARIKRAPAQSMADNFKALCAGDLDVVQVFEPYASLAVEQGNGHVVYAASSRGPTVYTTFIATRARIEQKRESFAGVLRAITRMQEWLVQHPVEELAQVTASFFSAIPHAVLVNSLRRYEQGKIWASRPDVSRQGFAQLGACLLSGGFISRPARYEDCVEQCFGS
jgi:NitT/TauT family transport system substrate-binding protein